jgi:hypothetical protein
MNTQQALVEVAKTAMGSLPEAGQVEVFNHLDDKARNKIVTGALAKMTSEERRTFLAKYPEVPESGQSKGPTIIIPSGILEIEKALGANFHGEDSWKKLGIDVRTPDLSRYPRLTLAFLDAPFEYNSDIKRSEAGIFVVTAAKQSINSFHKLTNEKCTTDGKNPAFYGGDWRQGERFANAAPKAEEIHFVLRDIAPNSVSKSFDEQTPLRKPGLLVAGARELSQAVGMQYMDSGERVYQLYGRTKNLDSDGYRVVVGRSDADGSLVDDLYGGNRHSNVGLALAWNLKKLDR